MICSALPWTRYSETKDDGGKVVLVRYPEGYRLRVDGETVWREMERRLRGPWIFVRDSAMLGDKEHAMPEKTPEDFEAKMAKEAAWQR